ncbi:FAD-dependent monooxygenase [Jannaschia ovalis]|uniref:FAD-dependent monooxygenase n=1 Tax=Jannaschia ovalis TaxID=3038773 RepID=A0ABY8LBH0_9RHOB|nr:FAD-dependent monooxygenase [Jannaschia sp. GRR-S6-38]WGH78687.1 FAD-dependent monooxygenase [Jannaschia sp. GRR-S6-38]
MLDTTAQLYPYTRVADQDRVAHHPVIVVGGGPVGLATALDLGLRDVPVMLLDEVEGVGEGSRAICFAQRTLEIFDRLGLGEAVCARGVKWKVGKVFHDDRLLYQFDLQPEGGHKAPAFVNIGQPEVEALLVARIRVAQARGAPIEIRGGNRVTGLAQDERVELVIETPDGPYSARCDWLVAADGARSPLRRMLGLGFEGRVFEDNFLIADVRMAGDFPTERWFWFEPHFRSGASALLHRQPDDIWRIDFQLGWDIDREAELSEPRIRARIDAMLGDGAEYELVWTSIYTFQCRRMERFRAGRVVFAGDSAHQVSPFGARGANSGIQDAENLAWKLAAVLDGAPDGLIDSYAAEREAAADENILHSTRATDFITPKTPGSRLLRDAALHLAAKHPFARAMVNSGRLSTPATYDGSALNGPDALPGGPARTRPGAPCPDAPLGNGTLLARLGGGFALLALACDAPDTDLPVLHVADPGPELAARYLGGAPRALYLVRPDQHVAARWAGADAAQVARALRTATGGGQ